LELDNRYHVDRLAFHHAQLIVHHLCLELILAPVQRELFLEIGA
jgi:hypothetical protein